MRSHPAKSFLLSSLLVVLVLLLCAAFLYLKPVKSGNTSFICLSPLSLRDWSIGSWSSREVDWLDYDGPNPPRVPYQIYEVQGKQFGPFRMVHKRKTTPRPGEVIQ
jgi:hypothetical protein